MTTDTKPKAQKKVHTAPLLTVGKKTVESTIVLSTETHSMVSKYAKFLGSVAGEEVSASEVIDAALPKILRKDMMFREFLKNEIKV